MTKQTRRRFSPDLGYFSQWAAAAHAWAIDVYLSHLFGC